MPPGELTHYGYTASERLKALAVYAETGSVSRAASAINAPTNTVWNWVNDANGSGDELTRIRAALRSGIAWDLTECSVLAAKAIRDRLLNGDAHVTKDGTVVYAPVKLRDAVMAMAVSADKVQQLAVTLTDNVTVNGSLDKLADALLSKIQSRKGQSVPDPAEALASVALNAEGLMG